MKIWQDGVWKTVEDLGNPFGTLAFQYGFGLFETILVQSGQPINLEEHIQRLTLSIQQLDTRAYHLFDARTLVRTVSLALSQGQSKNEVLKVIAYRGEDGWKTLLLLRPYTYSKKDYERGFSLRQSEYLRNPKSIVVYHKTLNYLENHLERLKAREEGYDDAYFLNANGVITECTAANLFCIYNGELITSPVQEGLLPGVIRSKLLNVTKLFGLRVREMPIQAEMLVQAQAVIITNSLMGVMPVTKIDEKYYPFDYELIMGMNGVLGRNLLL